MVLSEEPWKPPPLDLASEEEDATVASFDGLFRGQLRLERAVAAVRCDLATIQELLGGPRRSGEAGLEKPPRSGSFRSQWRVGAEGPIPVPSRLPGTSRFRAISGEGQLRRHGSREDQDGDCEENEVPDISAWHSMKAMSAVSLPTVTRLPPSLPAKWPASIEGRQVAAPCSEALEAAHHEAAPATDEWYTHAPGWDSAFAEERASRFVLHPNGNVCLVLAMATLVVLCHDMFMIPFVLAWEMPLEGVYLLLSWISCCFWTMDMFLSFITGYARGPEVELRVDRLVRHYATTWFLPDVIVLCADWFSLVLALHGGNWDRGAGSVSKLLRFTKLGKLVRLLSLLRTTKAVQLSEEFIKHSLSDKTHLAVRLMEFLLGITWLCHLICCGWFAVGKASSDTGMRWTHTSTRQGLQDLQFMEASIFYQYVTALHWSLAQFSLGAIEITCYNSWERIFNMVCIFVGLICGSVIVGTFSAAMMDYQATRKEKAVKLSRLRRYLREHRRHVSKQTAMAVQLQAAERLKVKEKLQEGEVQVLSLLSATLFSKLRFEIFAPLLNTHGLFRIWTSLDRTTMRKACREFLEYHHYRPQDEVFLSGNRTDRAHHVASGKLVYLKDPETAPVGEHEAHPVAEGTWLAEAGLWTQWIHVGTAKAMTGCEVLTVTSSAVDELVEHNPQVSNITKHYARQFLRCINESTPPNNPYPDDLEVPHTQFDEIVMSCQPSVQRAVSWHLFLHAGASPTSYRDLKDEIRQGKSCLVLSKEGKMQRMVSVVCLDLQNGLGETLVELAELSEKETGGQAFKPSLRLPGKKQLQGDGSTDTLCRILSNLKVSGSGNPVECLSMRGVERQVQQVYSERMGVETKYLRKVFSASAKDSGAFGIPFHDPGLQPRRGGWVTSSATSDDCFPEVPVVISKDKCALLAWLPHPTYEILQSPEGQKALAAWVAVLNEVDRDDLGITARV